ncbi:MAG: hypothetical protein ISQ27_05980 [PS1 clade bacterium]|nr:hypothetical protein [PS1 clade bacterium]
MTIENTEPPKVPEKATLRLVMELVFICIIVLLEVRFFTEISDFVESLMEIVGLRGGWQFLATFFVLMVGLGPFGIMADRYEALLARLKTTPTVDDLFLKVLTLNSVAAIFCSLFWLLKARGIAEATLHELSDINYFRYGFIIFISYKASDDNLRSATGLANGLKYAFLGCFAWVFYLWLGLDDGCTTTGGDPLFGGGGDIECDDDHQRYRERLNDVGSSRGFNSNAAFAVQYLFMTTASFLTITLVYIFRVKPKEQC